MLDFLLSLLAGWPAILTTVGLAIYGLVKNNYRFLLGAAILATPFSWYLSGFPLVRSPIFLAPVLIFGAAMGNALWKRNACLDACHPVLSRRTLTVVCHRVGCLLILKDMFVVMFFGFPATILSLLLCVIGVLTQKSWLVIIGAILFAPFSYYLSGSPGLAGLPILLPGFQAGSAVAVREKNKLWAWLLLAPPFFAVLWLAGVVLIYT